VPVSRDTIKAEVVPVLESVAHLPVKNEAQELVADLLLSGLMKEALAGTWTKISEGHGGKAVSRTAAKKAKKVGDVIDLVHKQSNAGGGK